MNFNLHPMKDIIHPKIWIISNDTSRKEKKEKERKTPVPVIPLFPPEIPLSFIQASWIRGYIHLEAIIEGARERRGEKEERRREEKRI